MFSGIVAEIGEVKEVNLSQTGLELKIKASTGFCLNLSTGCSVSVNGVCLTLVSEQLAEMLFMVVPESLDRSNLAVIQIGSLVNLERSIKFGDEIGGHLCSGHVDCQIQTEAIIEVGAGKQITFNVPQEFRKYILEKGYVAINGASITVSKKQETGFQVALIPETLSRTNLGNLKVGDSINLEIDRQTQAIVETVERILNNSN